MLDGKLILLDDDGKPLNNVDCDPVNVDSDVDVVCDETTQFIACGGAKMQAFMGTKIVTSTILMISK
ncbi:hypothetical protein Tco_0612098, partial [Tanacetum coccineum]